MSDFIDNCIVLSINIATVYDKYTNENKLKKCTRNV